MPGLLLMENAGRAVADFCYQTLVDPARSRVLILCGPGNNGGDGFVAARHLSNAGVEVLVTLAAPRDRYFGDARTNLGILERIDFPMLDASATAAAPRIESAFATADLIVDALLGTGASGPPRGAVAELVRMANAAARARRVAVDIPSGLDADRGVCFDPCFQADATLTLVAPKIGFASVAARQVLGRVLVCDIGLPLKLVPGRSGPP
ncbi:MAG: Bifunctional NAD(P)H-hydrate repair enzyme Nnr [Phycisphaerae bacterium]|nr:Bifunctional NAD(P)H-hydrate repair enzyme Nnr [Phycisphaerae bacterium]